MGGALKVTGLHAEIELGRFYLQAGLPLHYSMKGGTLGGSELPDIVYRKNSMKIMRVGRLQPHTHTHTLIKLLKDSNFILISKQTHIRYCFCQLSLT